MLLDLSMPVLDGKCPLSGGEVRSDRTFVTLGVGATAQMRNIEASRRKGNTNVNGRDAQAARILALTGMSSLEDKRRAFEAGVDG